MGKNRFEGRSKSMRDLFDSDPAGHQRASSRGGKEAAAAKERIRQIEAQQRAAGIFVRPKPLPSKEVESQTRIMDRDARNSAREEALAMALARHDDQLPEDERPAGVPAEVPQAEDELETAKLKELGM